MDRFNWDGVKTDEYSELEEHYSKINNYLISLVDIFTIILICVWGYIIL
jgi:hypothetical protein